MQLDPLFLSRLQFGLTVGFHFLFPPLTIGLAWLLVVVEGLGWWRDDDDWRRLGVFFGKILGLTFVVGVATGVVMEFQFGTNWAEYSKFVGDIFGAPLAAEIIFAFFLESTFLALYLFGRGRVSQAAHWFSILMVAVGATISAFWILVANSWQQTPAGFVVRGGRAELIDFYAAVLNDSMWVRFYHTMSACFVAGALLMAGISAYLVLRQRDARAAGKTLRLGLVVGLIASLACLYPTGHGHAVQVAQTQPEKLATLEGLINTRTHAPFVVFGIPSDDPPQLHYAVSVPGVLSWLAGGSTDAEVQGIVDLREAGHPTPPFLTVFASFHSMVALGMFFIGLNGLGVLLLLSGRLESSAVDPNQAKRRRSRRKQDKSASTRFTKINRLFLWLLLCSIPLPLVACELGWLVAEIGRQPWAVYRLLRTADAYSTNVAGAQILASIVMFSAIYLLLGVIYVFLLVKKVRQGPQPLAEEA